MIHPVQTAMFNIWICLCSSHSWQYFFYFISIFGCQRQKFPDSTFRRKFQLNFFPLSLKWNKSLKHENLKRKTSFIFNWVYHWEKANQWWGVWKLRQDLILRPVVVSPICMEYCYSGGPGLIPAKSKWFFSLAWSER